MAAEIRVVWAVALSVSSWGAALYALAFTIAAHLMVVQVEEPELRRRFGASYDEYSREVPRWFPALRRSR